MKYQKQPFKSVEKIASEFFFQNPQENTRQESHFNKPSYLKPVILLKNKLRQRCFTV